MTYPSLQRVVEQAGRVILGKERQIRLAVACLLARGHLLIEDLPGVGKTTLAHVLAKLLGLNFHRIQFTSDMLPADIIGVSIYDRANGSFKFHPGPVFSQFILADEVNRATPKTQSALLEAMEEHQVTAEGETRPLPEPFFVIATQNPSHQVGTFPLPESQLDRFLMRIELGYPDHDAERALLQGVERRDLIVSLDACLTPGELMELQTNVRTVHASPALIDYIQAIVDHTRRSPHYTTGLSPRAAIALLHASRAWALLEGRDKVLPEDVQAVLPGVAGHRLRPVHDGIRRSSMDTAKDLIHLVPIPERSGIPAMNLEQVLRHSQIYTLWKWAARRNEPEDGFVFLSQRRVYILPTRNGLVFAAALVVMLIGSINYNLSLGYVLTFLLAGMAVVSILHTFRNLAYLTVSAGRVEPVFAGEVAQFALNLDNARDEPRRALQVLCDDQVILTGVPGARIATVRVPVAAAKRGWLCLPRVTLQTIYPLGLFRAWSYVQPAIRTLVYPLPDLSSLPVPRPKDDGGDSLSAGTGTDDFAGLRAYQSGDSPRHVAWKALAGSDVMLTKIFMGRASREMVFDWSDLPPQLGTEGRLSRLVRYVLLAHEHGLSYGLRIPGRDITIDSGQAHRDGCLEALALYDDRRP